MSRPRMMISFSGGRTSAYMTRMLLSLAPPELETVVLFANTGQEHPDTLEFIHKCDTHFGFNTVWLECDPHEERGIGSSARVVDYRTASRNGAPFEACIKKYGIPNRTFKWCTKELKVRPMAKYLRSIGWEAGSYVQAVGIRADEIDRMSIHATRDKMYYPLIKWGVTKPMVLDWWSQQPFDLTIPEHMGNCTWCWKKSLRKHLTLMKETPEIFDFPDRMMRLYPDAGPGALDRPRRFFRGNLDVPALRELAAQPFNMFVDQHYLDQQGACGESCEPFADDNALDDGEDA